MADLPADLARDLGLLPLRAPQGDGRLWLPPHYVSGGATPDATPITNGPQRVLAQSQAALVPKQGMHGGTGWLVPANGTILIAGAITGAAAQWTVTVDGGTTWLPVGPVQPAGAHGGPPTPVSVLAGDRVDVSASVATTAKAVRVQWVPSALAGASMQGVVAYGPAGKPLPTDSTTGALQAALVGANAQPFGAAMQDASGAIVAANTAQQVLAANDSRAYVRLFNPSTTDTLWYSWVGAAAASAKGSFALATMSAYESRTVVATNALSIIGPTAGDVFTCNYA